MKSISCTREVLRETISILRMGGQRGEERVALWLSTAAVRKPAIVTEVYEPDQIADFDYFRLPPGSMRSLMAHLGSTRRRIVAQIHTHPGRAFHSKVDDEWAIIRHVGALSLVLPRFAAKTTPENFLVKVKTYEYSPTGKWQHRRNIGSSGRVEIVT
ncbi:MAG: hypothetical protein AB7M05_13810 [Alphaproteobacteria bacterium]